LHSPSLYCSDILVESHQSLPTPYLKKTKNINTIWEWEGVGGSVDRGTPPLSLLVYRRKVVKLKTVNLSGYHMTIRYQLPRKGENIDSYTRGGRTTNRPPDKCIL